MNKTPNIQRRTSNAQRRPIAVRLYEVPNPQYGARTPRKYDVEDRLLEFAVQVIDFAEALPNTRPANQITPQLLRSGTSRYCNHSEGESAESRKDSVHKLKIRLKELRETRRWIRLAGRLKTRSGLPNPPECVNEAEELIKIFVASIRTAERNDK